MVDWKAGGGSEAIAPKTNSALCRLGTSLVAMIDRKPMRNFARTNVRRSVARVSIRSAEMASRCAGFGDVSSNRAAEVGPADLVGSPRGVTTPAGFRHQRDEFAPMPARTQSFAFGSRMCATHLPAPTPQFPRVRRRRRITGVKTPSKNASESEIARRSRSRRRSPRVIDDRDLG